MPKVIDNVSTDLYDFLKSRFEIGESVDENGVSTVDPSKMMCFTFDYVDKHGEDVGCVVISLLADQDSDNSIKIYFGDELANVESETQKEWMKFLGEIRLFAKMHMLGFDVRNINKSTITRRDIAPMFESTFGPIDGTVRTSKQPLENMQIIIKHTDRVDPKVKNSRSRKIQKIYLSSAAGEKFLLPFKSLMAARAMARHIFNGGTPYDTIGSNICHMVAEMAALASFVRHMSSRIDTPEAINALNSAKERCTEIKHQLGRLSSQGGYTKITPELESASVDFDDDTDTDFFGEELDDKNKSALPYVMRAYHNKSKLPEEGEFEQWANNKQIAESVPFHSKLIKWAESNKIFPNLEQAIIQIKQPTLYTELQRLRSGRAPSNLVREKKKEILKAMTLTEADEPAAAGCASPFTTPDLKRVKEFHSKKELDKLKITNGEASPFSLLSKSEELDDENLVESEMRDIVRLSGSAHGTR